MPFLIVSDNVYSFFLLALSSIDYLCRIKGEDKNDVYDIGVILLEIILGRPIMFHNEVGTLKDLVSITFKFHIKAS